MVEYPWINLEFFSVYVIFVWNEENIREAWYRWKSNLYKNTKNTTLNKKLKENKIYRDFLFVIDYFNFFYGIWNLKTDIKFITTWNDWIWNKN